MCPSACEYRGNVDISKQPASLGNRKTCRAHLTFRECVLAQRTIDNDDFGSDQHGWDLKAKVLPRMVDTQIPEEPYTDAHVDRARVLFDD